MNKNFTWIFVLFTAVTLSAYANNEAVADEVLADAVEEVAVVESDSADEVAVETDNAAIDSTDEVAIAEEATE